MTDSWIVGKCVQYQLFGDPKPVFHIIFVLGIQEQVNFLSNFGKGSKSSLLA